nr:hypothetical protein [Oscillatoria laete-virens]
MMSIKFPKLATAAVITLMSVVTIQNLAQAQSKAPDTSLKCDGTCVARPPHIQVSEPSSSLTLIGAGAIGGLVLLRNQYKSGNLSFSNPFKRK